MSVSINRRNKTIPYYIAEVNMPKKAKVFDVIVLYDDDTQILFNMDTEEEEYEERKFLSIKMGQGLPDDVKLKYLGTAVIQKGHVIEQVYEMIAK